MRMYSVCSESHQQLRAEWMLGTLKDPWEIVSVDLNLRGSGAYRDADFMAAVRAKVDLLERAIDENWGQPFIVCDVDVQFFGPVQTDLLHLMGSLDLVAQDDGRAGYCAGFYVAIANERIRRMARMMRETLNARPELSEQPVFNQAIKATATPAGRLPGRYFNPGQSKRRPTRWVPGNGIEVPEPVAIHHANWTIGVENKLQQLRVVRAIFDERRRGRALP